MERGRGATSIGRPVETSSRAQAQPAKARGPFGKWRRTRPSRLPRKIQVPPAPSAIRNARRGPSGIGFDCRDRHPYGKWCVSGCKCPGKTTVEYCNSGATFRNTTSQAVSGDCHESVCFTPCQRARHRARDAQRRSHDVRRRSGRGAPDGAPGRNRSSHRPSRNSAAGQYRPGDSFRHDRQGGKGINPRHSNRSGRRKPRNAGTQCDACP